MEKATTDPTSTTEVSITSLERELLQITCPTCHNALDEKYIRKIQTENVMKDRGRKICEIVNELTKFINEKIDFIWETNSDFAKGNVMTYLKYNMGFRKHGYLSKNGRFSLKKDFDMFHIFRVFTTPGYSPYSATLFIGESSDIYVPIKTIKVGPQGVFCFFDCPFPLNCFPFENFSVEVKYERSNFRVPIPERDICIECINPKFYISIRDEIWKKMEEKNLYSVLPNIKSDKHQ